MFASDDTIDIAILTKAQTISEDLGIKLESLNLDDLGRAVEREIRIVGLHAMARALYGRGFFSVNGPSGVMSCEMVLLTLSTRPSNRSGVMAIR